MNTKQTLEHTQWNAHKLWPLKSCLACVSCEGGGLWLREPAVGLALTLGTEDGRRGERERDRCMAGRRRRRRRRTGLTAAGCPENNVDSISVRVPAPWAWEEWNSTTLKSSISVAQTRRWWRWRTHCLWSSNEVRNQLPVTPAVKVKLEVIRWRFTNH